MKENLLLFLLDGVFGYYLQAVSYIVIIYACNRQRLKVKSFFLLTIIFGIAAYGIRRISVISFGLHTILLIVSFVIVSVLVLKFKIFPTVIGTLLTTMLVLLCEVIVIAALSITIGEGVLQTDGSIQGNIQKSLYGLPINILLTAIAVTLYQVGLHKDFKLIGKESSDDYKTGA